MELFTLENLVTLFLLILLQIVLGLDNLLYISLESKQAPKEEQKKVRRYGIGIAIILRIILLFILVSVIDFFQDPILIADFQDYFEASFNVHSLIVLVGGMFILHTSIKEIWHMIADDSVIDKSQLVDRKQKSSASVIAMIVIMNLVFSFDSILAAIGLTRETNGFLAKMLIMGIAIVISGIIMMMLAEKVAAFLQKNRMYEVLGLFILFIVGVMLLSEGGHLAHMHLFGNEITPMNSTTFYFIITILIVIDVVQSKYQKKLMQQEALEQKKKSKRRTEAGL